MYIAGTLALVTLTLLAAWIGPRSLTLALAAATFLAAVFVYFHHATDRLPLSF